MALPRVELSDKDKYIALSNCLVAAIVKYCLKILEHPRYRILRKKRTPDEKDTKICQILSDLLNGKSSDDVTDLVLILMEAVQSQLRSTTTDYNISITNLITIKKELERVLNIIEDDSSKPSQLSKADILHELREIEKLLDDSNL